MSVFKLEATTTALVLIDLENGTVSMSLAPYTSQQIVQQCNALAQGFRAAGAVVVLVHVDMNAEPHPIVDKGRPKPLQPFPASVSRLVSDLTVAPGDKVIVKHQFGAFWNTDLHEYLQSRGVQTIVLAGIDTNVGVESTGRDAFDRGYNVVFAEDGMSSMSVEMQTFATTHIFPIFGRVRSSADVLTALHL